MVKEKDFIIDDEQPKRGGKVVLAVVLGLLMAGAVAGAALWATREIPEVFDDSEVAEEVVEEPGAEPEVAEEPEEPKDAGEEQPKVEATAGNSTSATGSVKEKDFPGAVNAAVLKPVAMGYSLLDNQIVNIINTNTFVGMSNYDKVLALYRAVMGLMTIEDVVTEDVAVEEFAQDAGITGDARDAYMAYQAVMTGKGTAEYEAALFAATLKRLGLVSYRSGEKVVVKIEDQEYGFEPAKDAEIGAHSVRYFGQKM